MITDVKHYVVNDQEVGRFFVNSVIDKRSMRESDLLAFEIALRESNPIMLPFVEIRKVGLHLGTLSRLPNAIMRNELSTIGRERELRIRPEKGCDLFRLHLIHISFVGFEKRIGRFESCFDLFP